jgi:hypothetical protein
MHPGGAGAPGATDAKQADPQDGSAEARRIRDEARRSREQMRAGFRARSRGRGDWAAWQQRSGRPDWATWAPWADWSTATSEDPPSEADTDAGRADEGRADAADARNASGTAGAGTAGAGTAREGTAGEGTAGKTARRQGRGRRPGPNPFSDLEHIAIQFATELRAAARQTGDLGERSLNDLRDILSDTLARVRDEVLSPADDARRDTGKPAGQAETKPAAGGEQQG